MFALLILSIQEVPDQKEIERALEKNGFAERQALLLGSIRMPLTGKLDMEGVNLLTPMT